MGICASKDEKRALSRQIDKELRKDASMQKPTKLLLLGAGESGKSTVFKQMKIVYGDGFSEANLKGGWKTNIYENILQSMQMMVKVCV